MFLLKVRFFFSPFFLFLFLFLLREKFQAEQAVLTKLVHPKYNNYCLELSHIELTVQARRHAAVMQWTDQTSLPKKSECPQISNFPGKFVTLFSDSCHRTPGWEEVIGARSRDVPLLCASSKKTPTWPILVSRPMLKPGRWPWTQETSGLSAETTSCLQFYSSPQHRQITFDSLFCFTGNFKMYASSQKEKQNT